MPSRSGEKRTLSDIKKYGWQVVLIEPEGDFPSYAYSVGLWHSTGHPDLAIFGVDREVAPQIINGLATRVREGEIFRPEGEVVEAMPGRYLTFVPVDKTFHAEYFAHGVSYYERRPFSVLQCVWPDARGLFPWQESYDEATRALQPILVSEKVAMALRGEDMPESTPLVEAPKPRAHRTVASPVLELTPKGRIRKK